MICPGCHRNDVKHPKSSETGDYICKEWPTCPVCGFPARPTTKRQRPGAIDRIREQHGYCFLCAFWENRARSHPRTVIDGYVYTPGTRTKGRFRGMAGRRFDIEYFDGTRITTRDLWGGGEVPEAFRDRIPDTARFLGAERVKVGETTCWNASPDNRPEYPRPGKTPKVEPT